MPLQKPPKYEVLLPQIVEMTVAGSGIDLISWAFGVGAEVIRPSPPAPHREAATGPRRQPAPQRAKGGGPASRSCPKHHQIAPEADRSRKEGEVFDRLAREMKASPPTVVRAYDLANGDEAAAAARGGRKPTRPPYEWSEESRVAGRRPKL